MEARLHSGRKLADRLRDGSVLFNNLLTTIRGAAGDGSRFLTVC
jgi:hypothetical protein